MTLQNTPVTQAQVLPENEPNAQLAQDVDPASSISDLESLSSEDSAAASVEPSQHAPLKRSETQLQNMPRPITRTDIRPTTTAAASKVGSHLSNSTSRQSAKSSLIGIDPDLTVPKNKRRGILPHLSLIAEYENSRNYPRKIKNTLVFVVAICAIIGPMGTSIMMPAIDDVASDLHTDVSTVNISVGIYLFTMGFFPIYWSNYSEEFGRRSVYLVSFILLVCFSIGCALSTGIGMLIAFRALSGAATASVQSVGAGSIGDMFAPHERGAAMGIFYLGPLGGPLFLPIIGGVLGEYLGWRSTQWFMTIFSFVCCLMIVFLLPETSRKEDNREAIRKILALRRRKPRDEEENSSQSTDEEKEGSNTDAGAHEQGSEANVAGAEAQEDRSEDNYISRVMTSPSVRSIERSIIRTREGEEGYEQDDHVLTDNFLPSVSRVRTNQQVEMLERVKKNELQKLLSRVIEDSAPKTKWQTFKTNCYVFLYKPLKSVVFLRYPPVLTAVLYAGPIFSCTYFVNLTLTYAYSRKPYNFSEIIVGLVYIPNSVAYIFSSIYGGKWNDKLLKDYAKKHNGVTAPEARIGVNVWLAAALYPGALLIIGWCLDQKTHWVTPLIGTSIFGFASMMVTGSTVTYLVDSLPGRGATGVALNNLIRMTLATVATFVTEPLIRALGIGVLFSILAGLCCLLTGFLVILKVRGTYWRENYDLERLYDILD